MFQTNFIEKIKAHILYSIFFFFFRKSCLLWDKVEKYCRTGQATDDNMEHAHCMLDTYGYKHTLIIYNTYCFSTTTRVVRTWQFDKMRRNGLIMKQYVLCNMIVYVYIIASLILLVHHILLTQHYIVTYSLSVCLSVLYFLILYN
jgi:hypothetical protein